MNRGLYCSFGKSFGLEKHEHMAVKRNWLRGECQTGSYWLSETSTLITLMNATVLLLKAQLCGAPPTEWVSGERHYYHYLHLQLQSFRDAKSHTFGASLTQLALASHSHSKCHKSYALCANSLMYQFCGPKCLLSPAGLASGSSTICTLSRFTKPLTTAMSGRWWK